jgi:hypothetical protein
MPKSLLLKRMKRRTNLVRKNSAHVASPARGSACARHPAPRPTCRTLPRPNPVHPPICPSSVPSPNNPIPRRHPPHRRRPPPSRRRRPTPRLGSPLASRAASQHHPLPVSLPQPHRTPHHPRTCRQSNLHPNPKPEPLIFPDAAETAKALHSPPHACLLLPPPHRPLI